ncbi:MAG: hypothetical protein AB7I57_22870 [Pirellulales bacterium]
MGLDNCGRGGLPADMIGHALRLLAREERLTVAVIAERVGCSEETIRKLKLGTHFSQRDEDRRGGPPERNRLALELLARGKSLREVARILSMDRAKVGRLYRGEHITQRQRR